MTQRLRFVALVVMQLLVATLARGQTIVAPGQAANIDADGESVILPITSAMGTGTVEVSGAHGGTITFGVSNGGDTYTAVYCTPPNSTTPATTTTSTGRWGSCNIAGFRFFRAIIASPSGTATVILNAGPGGSAGASAGGGGGGVVEGMGVAGTPAGGVVSVQGVTAGTPVPVDASISGSPTVHIDETQLSEAAVHGNPIATAPDGVPSMCESKDIDGGALPNVVTEGQFTRCAASLSGAGLVTLVNEAGTVDVGAALAASVGATGAAVPASASYNGINVAGNTRGQTGVNPSGSVYAAQIDITSFAGTTATTAIFGVGATAAAPPANANYLGANSSGATGGLVAGLIVCDQKALINTASNATTEIVALTSGRTIYVCGWDIHTSATSATNVNLSYGTGSNCVTGLTVLSEIVRFPASVTGLQGKASSASPFYKGMKTASANALCVTNSAAVQVDGIAYYAVL